MVYIHPSKRDWLVKLETSWGQIITRTVRLPAKPRKWTGLEWELRRRACTLAGIDMRSATLLEYERL